MSCPRCAAQVRPPDLMHSEWRCDSCGDVSPFHVAEHIGPEIIDSVRRRPAPTVEHMPLWCPWPLPPGWMVTGVGWAGDERSGVRATALSCSGPEPLAIGPGELRGHREGKAHPERAERTGVHPQSRSPGLHDPAGEGDDVAAVADVDRVVREELVDLVREPQRVDRRVLPHQLREAFLLGLLLLVERLMPDRAAESPQHRRAHFMDVQMMVMLGGRERNEEQFSALFDANADSSAIIIPITGPP